MLETGVVLGCGKGIKCIERKVVHAVISNFLGLIMHVQEFLLAVTHDISLWNLMLDWIGLDWIVCIQYTHQSGSNGKNKAILIITNKQTYMISLFTLSPFAFTFWVATFCFMFLVLLFLLFQFLPRLPVSIFITWEYKIIFSVQS